VERGEVSYLLSIKNDVSLKKKGVVFPRARKGVGREPWQEFYYYLTTAF